jgi:hypothetical protein
MPGFRQGLLISRSLRSAWPGVMAVADHVDGDLPRAGFTKTPRSLPQDRIRAHANQA